MKCDFIDCDVDGTQPVRGMIRIKSGDDGSATEFRGLLCEHHHKLVSSYQSSFSIEAVVKPIKVKPSGRMG